MSEENDKEKESEEVYKKQMNYSRENKEMYRESKKKIK
jgi:hypothetical protein